MQGSNAEQLYSRYLVMFGDSLIDCMCMMPEHSVTITSADLHSCINEGEKIDPLQNRHEELKY